MSKFFFTFGVILLLTSNCVLSQTKKTELGTKEPKQIIQNVEPIVYRLFPTENMWTFIKLNTRTGEMWKVQYDINGKNRFETFLNILPLVDKDKEVNGRFTLYPTKNIYTYILLDQIDGKQWQVQWSKDIEGRLVLPIEQL